MGHIRPMFSTPLYVEEFFDNEHLNEVCNSIEQTEYPSEKIDANNVSQTLSTDVLSDKKYLKIRSFIENCLSEYIRLMYGTNQKLTITQSWINKSEKGNIHKIHSHHNSIVSGILFLKGDQDSPAVEFFRPDVLPFQFDRTEDHFHVFNADCHFYKPSLGTLLLFPSNLYHYVGINTSDKPRISLSFNTWAYGSLGVSSALTTLTTYETGIGT